LARILVVEDSFDVADAMRMILETRGHEVRIAGTVADAVAACDAAPVDLMLLDVTLPDGDGLDVLMRTAARPAKILALTGWDEPAVIARCHAAGCEDVLLKPVPARQLLAVTSSLTE
jgi:DNA-binding response OmpR family regulator